MRYCGIAVGPRDHHLCTLEEVRLDEPPVRLGAAFYEPGPADSVVHRIRALGPSVVAIAGPVAAPREGRSERACDAALRERGVQAHEPYAGGPELLRGLAELGVFAPPADAGSEGEIDEGAFAEAAVFETNADAVLSALQKRRIPARRHPIGVQRRVEELEHNHVLDGGGNLWHRRIDEIDAAAAALCAHRYAVGHARWIGEPEEAVIVLPGSGPVPRFSTEDVLPPVTRLPLG